MREMNIRNITCSSCNKEGVIEVTSSGILDRKKMQDWYYSNNDNCFYCRSCSDAEVAKLLGEMVKLCNDNGTKIVKL